MIFRLLQQLHHYFCPLSPKIIDSLICRTKLFFLPLQRIQTEAPKGLGWVLHIILKDVYKTFCFFQFRISQIPISSKKQSKVDGLGYM